MIYYKVVFPNDTTFFFKDKASLEEVTIRFSKASGLKSIGGAIYNPKNFIYISDSTPVMKETVLVTKELSEIIID